MPAWLIRGLVLAAVYATADVAVARILMSPDRDRAIVQSIAIALLIGVALAWSATDGWLRKSDLGRTWLLAAFVAGPVSGVVGVIGRATLVDQTGAEALGPALTSGAAFTALLIIVPSWLGMFVGGRLEAPHQHAAKPAPGKRRRPASTTRPKPVEHPAKELTPSKPRPAAATAARPNPSPRPRGKHAKPDNA